MGIAKNPFDQEERCSQILQNAWLPQFIDILQVFTSLRF